VHQEPQPPTPEQRRQEIYYIYSRYIARQPFVCMNEFHATVLDAIDHYPQPDEGPLDLRLNLLGHIPDPASLPILPRVDRSLAPVVDLVLDALIETLDTSASEKMMSVFHMIDWSPKVVDGRLGQLVLRLTQPSHLNDIPVINRLIRTDPTIVTDQMIGYLVHHQLLHRLFRADSHNNEFLDLDQRWPGAVESRAAFADIHEHWDTRPESYPVPPPPPPTPAQLARKKRIGQVRARNKAKRLRRDREALQQAAQQK